MSSFSRKQEIYTPVTEMLLDAKITNVNEAERKLNLPFLFEYVLLPFLMVRYIYHISYKRLLGRPSNNVFVLRAGKEFTLLARLLL